jgi:hypothetical protein
MFKANVVFSAIVFLQILIASCMKENNAVDYSVIDSEKTNIKSALEQSQEYNDTLIMVYDTAMMHLNNRYCIKYDTLYHMSDSIFNSHYTKFCDEIYKNGMMMSNYTPSNGMMQGGMMNSGTMDMNRMMNDTSVVGGYYRNMQQLHKKHTTYHNGIYN